MNSLLKRIQQVVVLGVATLGYAQNVAPEVFASSGASGFTDNASIAFTIGEPLVETLSSNNTVVTQGFHQTNIIITGLRENLAFVGELQLNVYPNPTSERVSIELSSNSQLKDFNLIMYDLFGKQHIVEKLRPNLVMDIDVSTLRSGIHMITIINANGAFVQAFKLQITR